MAEKDTTKVTLFEDVYNESTSDSLYNDFLTGIQAGGGDITGLTKDIFKKQYESIYEKEFVKTYGFSQKDFKPAREEGGFEVPKIEGPSLGEKTSEFFGKIPEEAMIVPSVFAAKYLGGKGGKVYEGLKDVTGRGINYLKTTHAMPMEEIAHFMDSEDVQRGVARINKLQEKIVLATKEGLSKKKIAKLEIQLNKLVNSTAKFLTTDQFKIKEFKQPKPQHQYKINTKDYYARKKYSVTVDQMKDILKNHKNWSLFQFKGEISKVGWSKAAKDFFKKGTAITKIGQDLVSWKIGEGIGDVITEQTGVDFWGKDIAAGATGMYTVPKIARKLGQFIENLPAKYVKWAENSRHQKVLNKILKKRTRQTLTQIVAAYGSGGILTGPGAGTIIGLTGLGLMINDIRKLFNSYNEGDSEEKIEMSIEDALKKVDLPEDK